MKTSIRHFLYASSSLLCLLFVSCAGRMDPATLISSTTAVHRTAKPISAKVLGGNPSSDVLANVSNEDFAAALESSLTKSGMFSRVGSGGYEVDAFIISVQQPAIGISMTVKMEVSYTLKKNGAVVWRKSLKSIYTAPVGEAFVGAVRVRKATEGAARENISQLIKELDQIRP